jgi:hypothetical protein
MQDAQLIFCRQVQSRVVQCLDEFLKRETERKTVLEQIRTLVKSEQDAKREVQKARETLDKMSRSLESAVESAKTVDTTANPSPAHQQHLRERASTAVSKSKEHKDNAYVRFVFCFFVEIFS